MLKNIGTTDRILRVILGVALLAWAITGVPASAYSYFGWIGAVPLLTAALSWCPLYSLIGVKTCRTA